MNLNFLVEIGKLPLAGAIGGYVTFLFEKRKQNFAKNLDTKREMYSEFTNLIMDLFSKNKGNENHSNEDGFDPEMFRQFYDFYKKFILYASSRSIDLFGEWMAYLRTSEKNGIDNKLWMNKLSDLLGSMRKDLGLGNFWLGPNNRKIMRAIINDFDDIYQEEKVNK